MSRKIIIPSVAQGLKDERGAYIKKGPPPKIEPFKLSSFLFDKQLKFVEDPRPFKTAVCSRRSGKTIACAADLIQTALDFPDTISLYITLSRKNAKKLIWRELLKINQTYALGGHPDHGELSLTFPNQAIIYVSGAKDASEIEKFRGLPIKKCYVDECQSFREYIRELIDDIIAPALLDYAGSLCLIGTPGPIPTGYFYECSQQSDSWSNHGWTFFENPFIEQKSGFTHQQLLNRELKRRGVKPEDPSIQREFYGRWVLDSDALWIHYDKDINHFAEMMPNIKYTYLMGIDLGFEDADAIAILAWSEKDPVTYLVEELVVKHQGITPLVEQVLALQKKYEVAKMVIDTGGLGKKIAEEMIRRHQVPVMAADKARKQENVAFLNDALRTGRFKAKATSNFAKDSQLVEIDRSKSTPDKIRLSDKYHSDIIDAVLYAFKESPAFTYQAAAKAPPKWGSREWAKQQETDMFERELEGMQAEQELNRRVSGLGWPDENG